MPGIPFIIKNNPASVKMMESLGISEAFIPYLAFVAVAVGVLLLMPYLFPGQYAKCYPNRYDYGTGTAGGKLPHRVDRDPIFNDAISDDMAKVSF